MKIVDLEKDILSFRIDNFKLLKYKVDILSLGVVILTLFSLINITINHFDYSMWQINVKKSFS